MLLNNFYNCIYAGIFGKSTTFVDASGTTRNCRALYSSHVTKLLFDSMDTVITSSSYGNGIVLGDGTAEPTMDDSRLSGTLHGSSLSTTVSRTYEYDDNGITHIATLTITNNDTVQKTISEIGYSNSIAYSNSNSRFALMDRTLLDTPLTLDPGDVGQIVYRIRVSMPTT